MNRPTQRDHQSRKSSKKNRSSSSRQVSRRDNSSISNVLGLVSAKSRINARPETQDASISIPQSRSIRYKNTFASRVKLANERAISTAKRRTVSAPEPKELEYTRTKEGLKVTVHPAALKDWEEIAPVQRNEAKYVAKIEESLRQLNKSDDQRYLEGDMDVFEEYYFKKTKAEQAKKRHVARVQIHKAKVEQQKKAAALAQENREKMELLIPLYGVDGVRHLHKSKQEIAKEFHDFTHKRQGEMLNAHYQQGKRVNELFLKSKQQFNNLLYTIGRKYDTNYQYDVTEYPGGITGSPVNFFHDRVLQRYTRTRLTKPFTFYSGERLEIVPNQNFLQSSRKSRRMFLRYVLSLRQIPQQYTLQPHQAKQPSIKSIQQDIKKARKAFAPRKLLSSLANTLLDKANPKQLTPRVMSMTAATLHQFMNATMNPTSVSTPKPTLSQQVSIPAFRRTLVALNNNLKNSKPTTTAADNTTNDMTTTDKTSPSPQPEQPKKKLSMKELYHKYGKLVVAIYLGVYFATLAGIFATFLAIPGLDPNDMITRVKSTGFLSGPQLSYLEDMVAKNPSFTTFFAAWCTTKLTEPIRAMVTIFITKFVADRREAAKNLTKEKPSQSESSSSSDTPVDSTTTTTANTTTSEEVKPTDTKKP